MKAKGKVVVTKAKKKKAVARARIRPAESFSYKINGKPAELYENELVRETALIPIRIADDVLGGRSKFDIDVNISGGGIAGQAGAAQTAVAKALVGITESDKLKQAFLSYDRNLLVDDVRKKEPKKYLRKGARAKYQKSYR
ncbi:MAG: 30S ribosomal protein S9 [Candidatus Diapherotrites archaeon]|nr:30S ribosomal protein S9 [Candidatus Diapherotrites archaeon]